MKPLCFVLMPFGRKADNAGRIVSFDDVYRKIFAPAVQNAGLDVIRADEEQVGGSIHKPMFERLLLCDFAIADLTSANPNVYYELGIRHALRPRSTVIVFSEGTSLPFDVAPLRGIVYRVDASGMPIENCLATADISSRLIAMSNEPSDDSPVFQFIEGIPRIELGQGRSDVFRQRAKASEDMKARLLAARQDADAYAAIKQLAEAPELKNIATAEAGLVVGLFLAYRSVKAYEEMIALYEQMTLALQRTRKIQEQRGFALNRLGRRQEAIKVLESVLNEWGPASETYGMLGRVYKDMWSETFSADPSSMEAEGLLQMSIDTYYAGFQIDLRDPYPGVNALNLMQYLDGVDPRQEVITPVVLYSALNRTQASTAGYWDFASVAEVAAIKGDAALSRASLSKAIPLAEEAWQLESTARNLHQLRERRSMQGSGAEWIADFERSLLMKARTLSNRGE